MKKFVLAIVVLATLVMALVSTGQVSAQGTTPPNPQAPRYGNGGPMGGRGARSVWGMAHLISPPEDGLLQRWV